MAQADFWNPNPQEQYELDPNTGQYVQRPAQTQAALARPAQTQAAPAFDPSRAPSGVPQDWAADFISRNPGDYHRIESAYASERQGGADVAPQYQTPTAQWNAQPAQPPMQDQSQGFFKLLMDRIQQGTAVGRNDPNIRAQVDPVVAQQERASRNYIDDIAERMGPLANIQGERRLAAERSGQAAGALESEAIGREIAARRDEIAQALQLYGSRLSTEQQIALQQELAQLNASLQREGYGLQQQGLNLQRDSLNQANDQFLRELALREFDLNNTWDYRWQMGV